MQTDSALARDLGKATGWESTLRTNMILADIFDMLQLINTNICAMGGGKRKQIKPYPRPGKDEDNKRHFGKGALPYDELKKWMEAKRHGRRI